MRTWQKSRDIEKGPSHVAGSDWDDLVTSPGRNRERFCEPQETERRGRKTTDAPRPAAQLRILFNLRAATFAMLMCRVIVGLCRESGALLEDKGRVHRLTTSLLPVPAIGERNTPHAHHPRSPVGPVTRVRHRGPGHLKIGCINYGE